MNQLICCVIFLCSLFTNSAAAQNLKGIWKGHFFSDDGEQYRYEIQMQQIKDSISGVTYAFQDKNFYGKAIFAGKFTPTTKIALLQELKTIELRIASGSHSCIQKCVLTYVKSGKEEFLEGTYTSIAEKSDSLYDVKRGDDCGGGTMYLRKVLSSDFELEPFLTTKVLETKPLPVAKKIEPKTNLVPTTNKAKPPTLAKLENFKPKTDSITKVLPTVKSHLSKSLLKSIVIPVVLKSRENKLVETLLFTSNEITVKLFDNGEIDDDSISVYFDNRLVLSSKRLTAQALTIKLNLEEDDREHELIMVAENMGRIPPNTALMIVTSQNQRFELRITSTEQKNAMVKIKYVPAQNSLKQ
ncbi:MAG: hypothetical protein EPO57_07930 [Chitinophagaceae bacterium]|nr:MAG: hypothetical protein EPO57_07930 [Chitinophagaceae bacterium]